MSALGQKQTYALQRAMSALPPNSDRESEIPQKATSALPLKADMCGATAYVCFGPIAEIPVARWHDLKLFAIMRFVCGKHCMHFLATQPLWIAAVVLLIPTTIFAICGPLIVRRYVPLERLRENNKVAGFKFATVGTIYAVLLAFVIFVVWGRFNQAYRDVANEASAAETVLRLTQALDAGHGAAVRKATMNYLKEAVANDWPAMNRETSNTDVTIALSAIYNAVINYHTPDQFEALVVTEILRVVDRSVKCDASDWL